VNARVLVALAVAGVLVLPLVGVDDYYLHLLIMAGIFFMLAAGMNLLLAAGQLNLGHTAFFGIGAYASGLLALHFALSPLLTLVAASAISGLVGYLLGRLTLRLRGAYFVLVTVGFAEVIRLVATNWTDLTQGPMGLPGVPAFAVGPERFTLVSKRDYYYFMAVMGGGTLLLTARLLQSRVGRALSAIRENESLAESSGIGAYRHTMLALVMACVLAGAAGSFYAHYVTFLSPELFGFHNTVTMAVMVVGGGQGTVLGPAVGAVVFTFVPELLRMAVFYRMLLYGVILLLVVMFMPRGIVFYLRRLLPARLTAAVSPVPVSVALRADIAPEDDLSGPALAVRDVTVRFGGLAAVQDVSLELARGEILALIGPNGAGKSTVFNVMTGFQPPDAGRVTLARRDTGGLAPHRIAELGLVRMFQRTSIFPDASAFDNVLTACHRLARTSLSALVLRTPAYGREERRLRERGSAILAFVGLTHKTDGAARNLSCGEQRLLGLAIALAPGPSVLLLDEPAAGLNPVETERLMRLIEEIRASGISVLLVEHDMTLVMGLCDRIVVLNHGQKIAEGPPAEIRQNPEVIRAYLGSGELYAHA
jgi:branched-chain amino acid transport system ATP-binding protein/branched-chain amino acid transport system permease protein